MDLHSHAAAMRSVMSRARFSILMIGTLFFGHLMMLAQTQTPVQFEVVSIKRNLAPPGSGGGLRTLPDGTVILTNGLNRTGLDGAYAITLTFSQTRGAGAPPNAGALDDSPGIFTALQEQLGLKLQPEKTMVPLFVVDHMERPSEN